MKVTARVGDKQRRLKLKHTRTAMDLQQQTQLTILVHACVATEAALVGEMIAMAYVIHGGELATYTLSSL